MNFYICIDSCGCADPEIYDDCFCSINANRFFFERLIYTNLFGDKCYSISQKLAKIWGGYVDSDQVKPLLVKKIL